MSRPSRTVRLGVIAALLASGSLPAGAVGARGSGAIPSTTATTAASPATTSAATAAVAAAKGGPVTVLVTVDSSAVVRPLAAAAAAPVGSTTRRDAAQAAATAYRSAKQQALGATGTDATLVRDYPNLPVMAVRVPSAAVLARLGHAPGVISVDTPRSYSVAGTATPAPPGYPAPAAPPAWLTVMRQPQAVAAGYDGHGVQVAVLDTGVNWLEPGLRAEFGDCSGGPGTGTCHITRYVDATGTGVGPRTGHGTWVSGIVASTAPKAKLSVYNVFSGSSAYDTDILTALDDVAARAATENIRAANLSLGDTTFHTTECAAGPLSAAFLDLRSRGVVPVVASGNSAMSSGTFRNGIAWPSCSSGALSVGATYYQNLGTNYTTLLGCTDAVTGVDKLGCFSQSGTLLKSLAPGVNVLIDELYFTGTSAAAPAVAGALADVSSAKPAHTADQLAYVVQNTGKSVTDPRNGRVTRRVDIVSASTAAAPPGATVVLSAPATAYVSVPFTLTATVTSPAPAPTGTVTFLRDGSPICSAVALVSGRATCRTTVLGSATQPFTVRYNGDARHLASGDGAIVFGLDYLSTGSASGVRGDFLGTGRVDVVGVMASNGVLWVCETGPDGVVWYITPTMAGFGSAVWIGSPGDVNGDRRSDLLAKRADGTMWLYKGLGGGRFASPTQVGSGWGAFTALAIAPDVNADGRPDIWARRSDGALYLYSIAITGTISSKGQVGSGWGGMKWITGMGDLTGDGRADLLAVTSAGALYLYPSTASGALGSPTVLGTSGWGTQTWVGSPGDVNKDGRGDLYTRLTDGRLFRYLGKTGGVLGGVQASSDFEVMRLLM